MRSLRSCRSSRWVAVPCVKEESELSFVGCVNAPFFSEIRGFSNGTGAILDDGQHQNGHQGLRIPQRDVESICLPANLWGKSRQQEVLQSRELEIEGMVKEDSDRVELVGSQSDSHQVFLMLHLEEVAKLCEVVCEKAKSAGLEDALDELGIHITPYHISKILRSQIHLDTAIRVFLWADKHDYYAHNLVTFSCLLTALARAREFGKIWDLLAEIRASGIKVSDGPFNVLIRGYGEVGRVNEAIRTFIVMVKLRIPLTGHSLNTLLKVLLKSQKFELAVEIFQEMLACGNFVDSYSFNMVVDALCGIGQLQKALKVASDMKQARLSMDLITWTTLINGFCRVGKVTEALELFSDMKNAGIMPNVITHNVLLRGLCKAGKIDKAVAYVKCMREEGSRPNEFTQTILLTALCKAGRIDDGCQFLKEVLEIDGEISLIACSILVGGLSKLARLDEACEMCDKMRSWGYVPSVGAFRFLVQGLCKAGRVGKAFEYFNKMREHKNYARSPAIVNAMLEALSQAGWKSAAEHVYRIMVSRGSAPTSSCCSALSRC